MADNSPSLSLRCLVDGDRISKSFELATPPTKTFGQLRTTIHLSKPIWFKDLEAEDLTLWKVTIPITKDKSDTPILLKNISNSDKDKLGPTNDVFEWFPQVPQKKTIHIIVQRPPQVHAPVGAQDFRLSREKLQQLVVQIEDSFFAPDSDNYTSLVQFVKGGADIPTTEGTLSGLPFVHPRTGRETNQPSLLFLNLPRSVETQDPPSAADRALERIRERAIPLFPLIGVSGCGKTRTTIEMLSKNWGFYFNGSVADEGGADLGSSDLVSFLHLVQEIPRYQSRDLRSNIHVHLLAMALVLTRFIVLHHCLNIAKREGTTFTCRHWMLLQVGFGTIGVKDLFARLFLSLAGKIHCYSVDITTMGAFSQERFSSLRQRLLNLTFNTPSERFGYKILLVIDEAQNLSKEKFGIFPSERTPSETGRRAGADLPDVYKRPILSPLVHGLNRISADENHFCVVPCGTDFSALDMNWLEGAAPGPKGYSRMLRPFTDFRGWESLEQVQNYRDLVRRSLPNDKARIIFDTRVPNESVPELFSRLRGRFRPIVSIIEHMMTPNNGGIDWRLATKETEDALSSTESRYCGRGNIVFEISRMIRRVHNFEPQYAQYQNIKTTLKAFVLEHYLHGSPLLLDTEEAPLLEASVGRAHDLDGYTKTVLDEPIALRAAVNYFRRYDPEFYSAICTLLGLGSNASVHGYQLEMVVLPSLAHVFHGKILSHTGLVPEGEKSCDPILNGKAKIAGYVNHLALGTDPETMSLDAFLDAHVHHGSYKDGKTVPPFYLPAETPSGPDVAFVLRLDNQGYCPVFVQLKMRHKMTRPERQSKFSTVKADGVQGYLQEAMLQPFCTGYPQRFLGVAIDYPAKFADVEGTFPDVRRNEKIRSTQGDIPQCISLRIDKNNIHDLFPQNHTQALDMLKGIMRQLDQSYWLWE